MINLVASSERCVRVRAVPLDRPGIQGKERIEEFGCDGFRTFTPGPDGGGTYTMRVIRDGRYRGTQNYRLQVAQATVDDGAPGIPLMNGETARGSLSPRTIDVRDIYRFASSGRSMLTADLRNAPNDRFDLGLLTDTGSQVECACDQAGPVSLHRVIDRGRYYLVVRSTTGSRGSYKLTLLVREVTTTQLLVDGSTSIDVVAGPGRAGYRPRHIRDGRPRLPPQSAGTSGSSSTASTRSRAGSSCSSSRFGSLGRHRTPQLAAAVGRALARTRRVLGNIGGGAKRDRKREPWTSRSRYPESKRTAKA